VVMCCLLAADIQFDQNSPVPNPNNTPNTVQGSGTYTLNQGENIISIRFYARNTKTGQDFVNFADTNKQNKTWNKELMVFPGTYECWAVMLVSKGNIWWFEHTDKRIVQVK
ncbi:MAG: hypothetical protein RMJ88_16925, partial [Thermogemmata sp.]|nr:hypothetical protein [Thermogemmata sp.]